MNTPNDLKSPVFKPRPGWGGRLKEWSKRNLAKLLAVLVVLAVGTAIVVDQVRDNRNDGVAKVSPTPTPKPTGGTVSGSNDQRYEYAAAPGQGITHLARMAVTQYMKDNNTSLVAEQRIYAEDFLKDKTLAERVKSKLLEIGEKVSFQVNDVKSAVNAALALTAAQLAALAKYVLMVSGF